MTNAQIKYLDSTVADTIRAISVDVPDRDSRRNMAVGAMLTALKWAGYAETIKAFDELERTKPLDRTYVPTNGPVYNGAEGQVQS